jgi:hypothetical protein
MPEWTKTVLKLPKNHGWKAKPGYQVFVAARGAVRFDFPRGWLCLPGDDSIRFHDRKPPDDNCVLQVSVIFLPPIRGDWSALSLTGLVQEIVNGDERKILRRGGIIHVPRPDLELAWTELAFWEPNEKREARSRLCLARGSSVQPFITLEYWPEHEARFSPVWDEVLRSLQLGNYIQDPLHVRVQ